MRRKSIGVVRWSVLVTAAMTLSACSSQRDPGTPEEAAAR
jgi:hypothetical protein